MQRFLSEIGTRLQVCAAITLSGLLLTASSTRADPPQTIYRWGKPIEWNTGAGPEPREHGAVIVDEGRDRAILVGGSGYHPQFSPLNDVWEFRLKSDTWHKHTLANPAPKGGSRRVAQLPGRKVAYLFGGYEDDNKTHQELIRVDFSNETPKFDVVQQNNAPMGRCLHAFAYDKNLDQFILFGGVTETPTSVEIHNDLWTMRLHEGPAKWTRLDVKNPPSARYGFFWGYDPDNHELIVFGGAQGVSSVDPANDTWLLSMQAQTPSWKKFGGPSPSGRRNGCFVYEPNHKRLFTFGGTADASTATGDLWVFESRSPERRWIRQADLPGQPTIRASGFGFYDPTRHRILMGFGNGNNSQIFTDLQPLTY
jgi:N-acetylneuraminic acid mutarotase